MTTQSFASFVDWFKINRCGAPYARKTGEGMQRNHRWRRRFKRLGVESLEGRRVLAAAPLISEFQAANDTTLDDGDGNSSDWIELFNPSDTTINLRGWHLTDDAEQLSRWMFPQSEAIPQSLMDLEPGEQLVVFASGQEIDDYVDADGNLHTNFKLSASGEYLALVRPDGVTVEHDYARVFPAQEIDASYGISFDVTETDLVQAGTTANYLVPTQEITNWQARDFDDSDWLSGETGIGYENSAADYVGLIETEVPQGTATVYVRHGFEVADPRSVDALTLGVRYDDGFIAYLNGQLVAQENAPTDPLWNSNATSGHPDTAASRFIDYDVSQFADHLVVGANVLAVQSLNTSNTSSDMLIEVTLEASQSQLSDPLRDGMFIRPTPGEANGPAYDGVASDTSVSVDRGFFDAAFTVDLASSTLGADIVYTTDGTEPTASNGTRIQSANENSTPAGSIDIDSTTILRAATLKDDFAPGAIATRSYFFTEDIAASNVLDTSITQDPRYRSMIEDALLDIPSISLSFDEPIDNSTDEQRTSVEWLATGEDPGFQIDAGIRAFGGEYTEFAKKNFRLYFRGEYGATELAYPLFEGFDRGVPAAQVFDQLNLRSGSHDMVMRGFYMSNRFTDDTMLDLGHLAPHGRFVHVYLNGTYWGQYHLRERWNADMLAEYEGGKDDDYEAINGNLNVGGWSPGEAYDGDGSAWSSIRRMSGDYEAIRERIDVENYIDYMLLYMSGNSENEYRTAGTPDGETPFLFFLNDADGWLRSVGDRTDNPGPGNILRDLVSEAHPDFMMLLADRIQELFFNDGVLTPERSVARLQERLEEVEKSFIVESARWGYRTPTSFNNAANDALEDLLPSISRTMISRLRSRGFLPALDAPTMSQHGGSVAPGMKLELTSDVPDVANDNLAFGKVATQSSEGFGRLAGNATNGDLSDFTHTVSGDLNPYLEVDLGSEADLENIVIHNRENCCQNRLYNISIQIRNAEGTVVYTSDVVNPVEEGGTPTSPGSSMNFDLSDSNVVGRFVRVNKVAVNGANSTEWLSVAELEVGGEFIEAPRGAGVYYTRDGVDPRLPGGDIHPDALLYTDEIEISAGDVVNTRAYDGKTWSPLNVAEFEVSRADASNLRITEMHFNPSGPQPEAGELDVDSDDFEFVELENIGESIIELAGARFSEALNGGEPQGIKFTFPPQRLKPGETVLVVKNTAAFESRYGAGKNIAGEYEGKLSNGGELISLFAADGKTIQQFAFDDSEAWPAEADGDGRSMVIVGPQEDYGSPTNWRASRTLGGTPGVSDLDSLFADLNDDGEVGFADFLLLSASFGKQNATYAEGDIDGDDAVTFADFLILSSEFGKRRG